MEICSLTLSLSSPSLSSIFIELLETPCYTTINLHNAKQQGQLTCGLPKAVQTLTQRQFAPRSPGISRTSETAPFGTSFTWRVSVRPREVHDGAGEAWDAVRRPDGHVYY